MTQCSSHRAFTYSRLYDRPHLLGVTSIIGIGHTVSIDICNRLLPRAHLRSYQTTQRNGKVEKVSPLYHTTTWCAIIPWEIWLAELMQPRGWHGSVSIPSPWTRFLAPRRYPNLLGSSILCHKLSFSRWWTPPTKALSIFTISFQLAQQYVLAHKSP